MTFAILKYNLHTVNITNLSTSIRLYFTAIVSTAIWSLLIWNYYHGGVPSHHLLAREDLPSVSNWWGALLIPVLTWFLLLRIHKRIQKTNRDSSVDKLPSPVMYAFVAALFFGVTVGLLFSLDQKFILDKLFIGVFVVALFRPVYRAECLLGFVLGMTYTFGAVLPTLIGIILIAICIVMFQLLRPLFRTLASLFLRFFSKDLDVK